MSQPVRYLTVQEALIIFAEVVRASSKATTADIRDLPGLESALAQPQQTFDGKDLYETIEKKAAALLYSLCQNHPFVDGNKRTAFLATRTFLRLNGLDLAADRFDAIDFMHSVARGEVGAAKISEWVTQSVVPLEGITSD